jgi:hypothetical protein
MREDFYTSESGVVLCRDGFSLSAMLTLVVLVGVVLGIAVPAMAEGPCPDCKPGACWVPCGQCKVANCYENEAMCPTTPHWVGETWCNTPTYPGCAYQSYSCYYSNPCNPCS